MITWHLMEEKVKGMKARSYSSHRQRKKREREREEEKPVQVEVVPAIEEVAVEVKMGSIVRSLMMISHRRPRRSI